MIIEFASRDTDRLLLNSVTFDDIGLALSTDGCRLFATKNLYTPSRAGKTYDIYELINSGTYKEINEKYVDWRALIRMMDRAYYKNSFLLEIPGWFIHLKNINETSEFIIDFQNVESPKIICGNLNSDFSIVIDGRFLAPFSGKIIYMTVDSCNAPIIISPIIPLANDKLDILDELKNLDWFALIMPIINRTN
jgi:hypothetical protein